MPALESHLITIASIFGLAAMSVETGPPIWLGRFAPKPIDSVFESEVLNEVIFLSEILAQK